MLRDKIRIDGRGLADIRPLHAEVSVIPRVHGSALFERGETQILGVTTLNMLKLEQQLDTLSPEKHRRYMHKYVFPPFSTGETGRVGSPKRREVGHGALARRALLPVLPSREEFPYAIRQLSEAMGSNGSTSMGSVCASTLSLLQAGVPLKASVAGIAMGLISDEVDGETQYVALTDILGAEDAFGDMDFKVAGTREFVTALQLDTKLDGIPAEVLAAALTQARDARLAILDVMAEAIDAPEEMSVHAPRIITVRVPVDKIGEVIGPKGKVINQIQDDTGATLSIEDDGTVYIGATNGEAAEAAKAAVNAIANPTMPEVGERYLGTVVKTTNFGAFVSLMPGKDGLLHISKLRALAGGKRVEAVEDVLSVGQKVQVSIAEIDDRGKLSLVPVVDETRAAPRSRPRPRPPTPSDLTLHHHDRPAASAGRSWRSTPRASLDATPCFAWKDPRAEERHHPHPPHRQGRRRGGDLARTAYGPAQRPADRHRADGRHPLGQHRRVGQRRVARRDPGPARLLALPRAPALQGHPRAHRDGDLGRARRGGRRVQRLHHQGVHRLPRPGPRRGPRRPRSTCSATWSPPRPSPRPTSRPSAT